MDLPRDEELEFAVATVDSYILNGSPLNYPGTIVAVIDESKGGDAIVAWKDRLSSLDALKANTDYKIAIRNGAWKPMARKMRLKSC